MGYTDLPFGLGGMHDDVEGVLFTECGTHEIARVQFDGQPPVLYLATTEGSGEDATAAGFEIRSRAELDQYVAALQAQREWLPE